MNEIISTILERRTVSTPEGNEEPLHSNIEKDEVDFLYNLIRKHNIKRTLEVGCAMGISSLVICDAISKNGTDTHHTIVDPYQHESWKGLGVYQLKKAGFQNFDLIEEPSEFALPKLAQAELQFDMVFIDGWHTFDQTLIDFYFANRLLPPGGIIIVDDVKMPAVRRVMRMIQTYPCYRYLDSVPVPYSKKGVAVEALKSCLRPVAKLLGRRLAAELVDASVVRSDRSLGLDASVIAFQKMTEDNRPWNWYENF